MNNLDKDLNDTFNIFMSETIVSTSKRTQEYIGESIPDLSNVALYGAGNLGKITLKKLRQNGVTPLCFIDDTESLIGTYIDGLSVISRNMAKKRLPNVTVVVTILNPALQYAEAYKLLTSEGFRCTSIMLLGWIFPDSFKDIVNTPPPRQTLEYRDNITLALDVFSDLRSIEEFKRQILWRLTLDYEWLPQPRLNDIYFPEDINLNLTSNVVFLDLGAYDGDTVKDFLKYKNNNYKQIIAVEPDPHNYTLLEKNLRSLVSDKRAITYNLAVGVDEGFLKFRATGDMSATFDESGDLTVSVKPLHYFFTEHQDQLYIKFDIEGAEWCSLNADIDLIAKYKPNMAISIYHDSKDIWRIPLLMKKTMPNALFYFRSHGVDGTDVVLYVIQTR